MVAISVFDQIKKFYKRYHEDLTSKGELPLRSTELGFWGGSNPEDIFELFSKIRLSQYKNFLDLGSGDGIVVLIASLFTNATGIEVDKELFETSQKAKKELRLKAEFIQGDYFEFDISEYDIVFINPDSPFSKGLGKKLSNELKGKLIVYDNLFEEPLLRKEDSFVINRIKIGVYKK